MKRFSLTGALLAYAFVVLAGACGDNLTTGGHPIEFSSAIEPASSLDSEFVNDFGWSVHVERALVSGGPLYGFAGAPLTERMPRLLRLRRARAHPGHYVSGEALLEVLEPWSVDLVEGRTSLPNGSGVSGTALSASFAFHAPPEGAFSEDLAGRVVLIEGTATMDDDERRFRLDARAGDVSDSRDPSVTGCPFEEGDLDSDGTLVVAIDVSLWLDQVDFAEIPSSQGNEPVDVAPGSRPHEAFVRGLLKAAAYRFSFSRK